MYEDMTYEILLKRMLGRVPDNMDKRESSLIWDTHSSTAVELQNLYIGLDVMIANSYGDTAARDFLILLCKDRGIIPEPATHAVLKGEFTPSNIDVLGQRFNIGEINYIVTEKIADGIYKVECEELGNIGNQYLGEMIPMEYIKGLQTACLTGILIPGEDEEDTEKLRKRYFDSFGEQAFGGNRADYLAKVRKIEGVGNCKITRVWNSEFNPAEMIPSADVTKWYKTICNSLEDGVKQWLTAVYQNASNKKLTVGGTVLVTVVNSYDYGEVSDVLISQIQTELDPEENAGEGYGIAPIGHVVRVKSATPVVINIKTTLTYENGYSWSKLQTSVEKVIQEYLLELRKEWADASVTVVRISQIEPRILSINGIIDAVGTTVNESTENISLGTYEIPVFGGIIV